MVPSPFMSASIVEAPDATRPERWSTFVRPSLRHGRLDEEDFDELDDFDEGLWGSCAARPPPGPRRQDRSLNARQQRVKVKRALSIAAVHQERHREHLGQWSGPGSPVGGLGGRGAIRPTSERPHGQLQTVPELAASMQKRHGSVLRGFRRELDLRSRGYASFADLTKFFHRLGPGYKAHPFWANLGRKSTSETSPPLRLRELEAREADALDGFLEALAGVAPLDLKAAWDVLDLENQRYLTREAFQDAYEALGLQGFGELIFRGLDRDGHGRLYFADLEYGVLISESPAALGFRSTPAMALKFQDLIHFVHQEFASVDAFLDDLGLDASLDVPPRVQPPSPTLDDAELETAAKTVVEAAGSAAERPGASSRDSLEEREGSLPDPKAARSRSRSRSISVHHLAAALHRQGFPGDCILVASQVCRAGSTGGREAGAKFLRSMLLPGTGASNASLDPRSDSKLESKLGSKAKSKVKSKSKSAASESALSPEAASPSTPSRRPPFDSRVNDFSLVQADICPAVRTSISRLASFSPSAPWARGARRKKVQRPGSKSYDDMNETREPADNVEKQLASVALDAAQAAVSASQAAALAANQARRCVEDSWHLPGPSNPGLAALDSVLTQLEARCPEEDEELVAMLGVHDDSPEDEEGPGESDLPWGRSMSTPSLHPDQEDPRFGSDGYLDDGCADDNGYGYGYDYRSCHDDERAGDSSRRALELARDAEGELYGYADAPERGRWERDRHPDPAPHLHAEHAAYGPRDLGPPDDLYDLYDHDHDHYYPHYPDYPDDDDDDGLPSFGPPQEAPWEDYYWEDPVETARRRVKEAKGQGRTQQDPPRWCTCPQDRPGFPRRGPAADFRSARPSGRPRLQQ